uniref:CDK5 and ABL1 enzyme substrate 2 isoform X2 n=1 Tax=Ciona intestinalis TaxID=7719 RepID=UPI00089DC2E0|nr:CDK5 and ABL1 enzyme substrate 2 isoform X2 [Ciona intestinalis]|eukprot:XP_026691778.1 CDK5 and ABL1 enzyme substrate 2 isoform X2 [Ciona intestinalis]
MEQENEDVTDQRALMFLTDIPLSLNSALKCHLNSELNLDSTNNISEDSFNDSINSTNSFEQEARKDKTDDWAARFQGSYHYKRSVSNYEKASGNKETRKRPLSGGNILMGIPSSSRQWQSHRSHRKNFVTKLKNVTTNMMLHNRVLLVSPPHNNPCAIYSVIQYGKHLQKLKGASHESKNQILPQHDYTDHGKITSGSNILPSDKNVVSYKHLLSPTISLPEGVNLQSSEWTSGKHRVVLTFKSHLVSFIKYTKPSDLKRDLNLKFKEAFPQVAVTLSKVRSLERQMLRTAKIFGLQTGVLACAKAYFERLLFNYMISKSNRHHIAAVCLLISAKVHGDLMMGSVANLLSSLEHSFKTSKSNLLRLEFSVFAALDFSLAAPIDNES